MLPVIPPKKEDKKENVVSTDNISGAGNVGNKNIDDDDNPLTGDDIRQVNAVDKIFKVSEALERRFENKFNRNQPVSFGEKLGMKIEEKISDTMIDKMLTGMFNVGGTNPAKPPEGWLAMVKTILDSGYFQHAGARLPETIEALGKTIGKQKTEQLADAVVQAVNPKKSVSIEDEQRKMEEHVLSLNPVNIVDIKKFMDLVNANPANAQITDIGQARNILIEEQDRIRRDRKLLSPGIEENPDIDRGQPMRQSPMGQRDNFMDSMMGTTPMDRMGSSNQMTSEQILSLDPRDDASITAYAWSQGHGNMLSEPNGINKVRNILMRHQDDLMKQASGLGGPIEQPMTGEQPLTTEVVQGDFGWNEEDIGKKGVGRMDKKGEVLVPPHIESADSPVTKYGEVKEDRSQTVSQQEAQNSIMELLQKMVDNFDNGISEMNNKLQMMENRINKIESQESQPIQITTETIIPDTTLEIEDDDIENIVDESNLQEETKIEDLQEEQKDIKSNIQVVSTKDETWWKNKKDNVEEVEDKKNIDHIIRENDSIPVLDDPKDGTSTPKKHEKGSIGWLREQKRLKEQKASKDNKQ